MAAGGAGADSARDWRERARDGAEEVEGEVVRLGARGIERGGEDVAGAAAALLCSSSTACSARARKGERGGKNQFGELNGNRERLSGGRGRRRDAWRRGRRDRR